MKFEFQGIQFGFALRNGNVSRIFQTLGAEIDQIPIWIAAPVRGLIVHPVIGHMRDKNWGRLGLAWASIQAMPFAILTGSLPSHSRGVYMGIFNFFIVIPKILAATILGFEVKSIFGGDSIYALLSGEICMLVAAVLILFVKDTNPN